MSRDNLQAKGTVTEVLPHDAYRVELANGHRCIGKTSGEARQNAAKFLPGDQVSLEFHPYDLSRGRIIG